MENNKCDFYQGVSENKRFSIVARIKSTTNATRGLVILFKTTHNFWLQIFFGILAVYLGFLFNISSLEWIAIVFSIGLVFFAEAVNTAIEIDLNLTCQEYHPYARDSKDVSAGAVLLTAIIAGIIGLIIFLPKIINLF